MFQSLLIVQNKLFVNHWFNIAIFCEGVDILVSVAVAIETIAKLCKESKHWVKAGNGAAKIRHQC